MSGFVLQHALFIL